MVNAPRFAMAFRGQMAVLATSTQTGLSPAVVHATRVQSLFRWLARRPRARQFND